MQQEQPSEQEFLGSQGNEGMYGQGQYDSEGKPDPRGPEAQRLKPDVNTNRTQPQESNQQNQTGQQAPQNSPGSSQ